MIVDSREQLPLFTKEQGAIVQKLDVGDYTIMDLLGKVHIERKSPGDLYGSIIQGHNRFRKEMMRAKESNIKLIIMVECPENIFVGKAWGGISSKLRTPSKTLQKIINTIQTKYEIQIIWCYDRKDMIYRMQKVFNEEITKNHNDKEKQSNKQEN